jgi:acetylornithine deacetylase/succinyl-diaminopimelate desuccinylase-like protein
VPNPTVKQYLDAHRDDHLASLCELLRFASIANNDDDQCDRCVTWLLDYLTTLGLATRTLDTGGKPIVYAESAPDPTKPTVLIYGHYDVQPADPLDLWTTDPFEPAVRDGHLYGRGTSDDKGQLFVHLMAIEAWQQTVGELPVNVKVFIEGEEEIGSPTLEACIVEHKELLAADAAVISDSAFFEPGRPSLATGLRGLAYVQIDFTGPGADLHSGIYGGVVTNPINALTQLLASMFDDNGKITIPGFYDDVVPLSDTERAEWDKLEFDESQFAADAGLTELGGGERGLPTLERRWARPTLDINGILGGYTGHGAKTVIPSTASAKLSMRLVADQDPDKIIAGIRQFVADNNPSGITATLSLFSTARPVLLDITAPGIIAADAALSAAYDAEVSYIRYGASVPITELFKRILGLDSAMMGFGLPDDNLHSPNEKLTLDQFYRGAVASADLMERLATQMPKAP